MNDPRVVLAFPAHEVITGVRQQLNKQDTLAPSERKHLSMLSRKVL
jgi:hypothetical protein